MGFGQAIVYLEDTVVTIQEKTGKLQYIKIENYCSSKDITQCQKILVTQQETILKFN